MIEAWLIGATYVDAQSLAEATHSHVNETSFSATIKRLRQLCPDIDSHLTYIVALNPGESAVRYASKTSLSAIPVGTNTVLLCGGLTAYQQATSKLPANPISGALREILPWLK